MNSSKLVLNAIVRSPPKSKLAGLVKLALSPATTCQLHNNNQVITAGFHHQQPVEIIPPSSTHFNEFSIAQETEVIFDKAWSKIEPQLIHQRLPNDILWLIGAPGSGKGTVTPHILKAQATTNSPICMSSLLQSPQLRAQVDAGRMVDDLCVLDHLLSALLSRNPLEPLIIDGFPRTERQVQFVTLLHRKLKRACFKVAILYVSQSTSLARQLQRGLDARLHNELVRKSGQGKLWEERKTDCDKALVMTRYKAFEEHMSAIMGLSQLFPFHMINADCQLEEVVHHIIKIFDHHRYPPNQLH